MGVLITFNLTAWRALFPQFPVATYSDAYVNAMFAVATTICRNDGGGPINNIAVQTQALNFLTAHLCALYPPGSSGPGPVGRISSAAEGSVNVSTEWGAQMSNSQAFFAQTQYGATYWKITGVYRTFRYRPGVRRNFNPWPFQ